MRLELADCARPSQVRFPTFAPRDRAADLCLIHGLRSREPSKLIQVNPGDGNDAEHDGAAANPNRQPPGFERVHCGLNKFFATRHCVSLSSLLLSYSRSIR